MKAIEKLKTKRDEIKTKIDDHSEQISNVLIAAGAGIWLATTACGKVCDRIDVPCTRSRTDEV